MILEGIVTTINADGGTNIAPMGPIVDPAMTCLRLRPYPSSTTYRNLVRYGEGVFHVTDDVLLIAQAAIGDPDPLPAMQDATAVNGCVLSAACRWYAFRVEEAGRDGERTRIDCRVVAWGRLRDFFGFNRAKHAVIEAAILATRTKFLPADEIRQEFCRLSQMVSKTGGEQEFLAFSLLEAHVTRELAP